MEKFIFLNSNSSSSPATISIENFKALEECGIAMVQSLDMSIEILTRYKENVQGYLDRIHTEYGSIAGAPQYIRDDVGDMIIEIINISEKLSDKKLLELLNKNWEVKNE